MRIALVHPYPWPEVRRGAERYVDDLSWYLAERGHEVAVVTGTHVRPGVEHRSDGVTVHHVRHRLAVRGARFGVGAVETFGAPALLPLMAWQAQVVHAFTPSATLAGRMAGRPTVFSIVGHPHEDQLPVPWAPRSLLGAAVRRATVTAALSAASAEAVERTLGRHAEVLSPGVRLERFHPELAARRGPPRVLVSATLEDRRKRVDRVVAAFSAVLDRHPGARLGLSGEGDPSWALAGAPQRVRAAVDVLGPGRPDEVPQRYRAATVTVLPAEHEAFGLALVESLASGTPVVCTPDGGMPDIVGGQRDAGAIPVGAVADDATLEALADAMLRAVALAADDATPPACVARARRWDWRTSVGPRHEALYRRLVDDDRGRATTHASSPDAGAVPARRSAEAWAPRSARGMAP